MKLFTLTSDKLPTESGDYVVITLHKRIYTCPYSGKHNVFNACDSDSEEAANDYAIPVIAWCPWEDFMKEIGCEVE